MRVKLIREYVPLNSPNVEEKIWALQVQNDSKAELAASAQDPRLKRLICPVCNREGWTLGNHRYYNYMETCGSCDIVVHYGCSTHVIDANGNYVYQSKRVCRVCAEESEL